MAVRGYIPASFPQLGDQRTYLTGEYDNIAKALRSSKTVSDTNSSDITALKAVDVTLGNRVTVLETGPTAWAAWTPTITPSSGTFTSASAAGRYKQLGKIVFFSCRLTVTTVGSATGAVDLSVPVTAQATGPTFMGRENASSGNWFLARIFSTSLFRLQGDVTGVIGLPLASGYALDFSGSYEAA